MLTDKELPPIGATFGDEEPIFIDPERAKVIDIIKNPKFVEGKPISNFIKEVYSWQPSWFIGWSTGLVNRTTQMGEDVVRAFETEKIAKGLREGKTIREMEEEGEIIDFGAFDVVQKETNRFALRYTDELGNELQPIDLAERGKLKEAGGLAAEQAISNLYSMLATTANPIFGAAVIGTSSYGSTYLNDLQNRFDPKTMTDEDLKNLRLNAFLNSGAEFAGEYIGGRLFRSAMGLAGKGIAEKAVKEFGESFIKRVGTGFFKGFGAEFLAEGLTNTATQFSEKLVYKDKKEFKDFFRGFINDGFIGGLLGGPLGGVMSSSKKINKDELYLFLSSKQHQQEVLKNNLEIQKAEAEAEKADESTREFYQKRVDILNKKKDQLKKMREAIFKNKTTKARLEHAKKLDRINKLFNVYTDSDKSYQTRKDAKEEIENIYKELNEDNNYYINEKLEFQLAKAFKIREVLDKRQIIPGFGKDLKIKYLEDSEQVAKAIEESGESDLVEADGMFLDGKNKIIYINKNVAAATGAMNVIGHEILHYIFSKNFKTDNESMKPMVDEFKKYLVDSGNGKVLQKIEKNMRDNGYFDDQGNIKDGYLEEYFQHFSNLVDTGEIEIKEENAKDLATTFKNYKISLGFTNVKLETGKDVFDFIKLYNKNITRKGLIGSITKRAMLKVKIDTNIEGVQKADKTKSAKKLSKSASNKVQEIYEDKGVDGAFDIIEQFKPITTRLARKYTNVPGYNEELLVSEIEIGERGILDLINSYNPDSRVPLAAYINKFLPSRTIEAAQRILDSEFTQDINTAVKAEAQQDVTETETTETKVERKKIVLAERLGITKQVAEAINKIVPNLDINKLTFKTLKNEIPEITGDLFGIAAKKIESLANITKKELQSAQMFINKNADLLIAMLPEGVTASGTATGVPRTLLNEFYTKGERVKAAKTGSRAGLAVQQKNSNITKKQFLEVFGIIDGKPTRNDRNTSARVLALANLTGKMITNQAVRQELAKIDDATINAINKIKDGKSKVMFSKKNIRAKSPFKIAPTNKSSKDRVVYKNALRFFYEEIPLPVPKGKATLHKGTFARGTSKSNDVVVDNYYMSAAEADTLAIEIVNDELKRSRPFTKEQKSLMTEVFRDKTNDFNKLGKNLELLKKGVTYYLNRWNTLVNDKKLQKFLLTFEKFLESSSVAKEHGFRMMAAALGATNVGVIKEREHVLVQNVAGEIVFDSLVSDNLSLVLPWFVENYYMIGLSKSQNDQILKELRDKMPDIFYENLKKAIDAKDMSLASDPLIRYTVSNLNLTEINWHTGGNLLQHIDAKYGFNGELTYGNNSDTSIENINNVLTEFFGKEINKKQALQKIKAIKNVKYSKGLKTISEVGPAQANTSSLKFSKTSRGMSTFDFDETLIDKGKNIIIAEKDGDVVEISSADWPLVGDTYKQDGYNFNFDDFINIRGGVEGPLLQKMRNQISKFGPDNVFVLTARPPQSAKAIHDWLKSKDINIPLKNITGLGNSTGEAKAMWMLKKFEEGYNDMYFVDDALPNVKAVKDVLDQLDIKSNVQQVNIKFSKNGSKDFNKILEEVKNINRSKQFGEKTAARMGATKGRYRFFVPPTHEDFIGLIYNFIGKGKAGNRHRKFFEDNLIKPLNRAFVNLNKARQAISNDYVNLLKQSPNVKKLLNKKVPGTEYFYSDAVRVYLWNKFNFNIPGLLESEIKELVEVVTSNGELQVFADNIGLISRQENGYIEPNENWQVGDIRTDLQDATGRVGRAQFFNRFFENADVIFSQENLNKIEAIYGTNLRESIKHMLDSIRTGTTRNPGDKRTNQFLDYINGSVGATMFFNIRSMLLQQLSNINFINWGDNNVFKAAAAFANQKQYWNDFALLFNSDFLKQRRSGIAFDVNGNELAKEISKSKQPFRATVRFLLQKGFAPTQFGDSLAIAIGGATMYRNRIKTYLKQGLSKTEAEKKAFEDFVEVAEATQQSARMDMIGMQQKLPIGKILLAFQNYGSQVVRIKKKAVLDLINRRITPPYKTQKGSDMANVSKIIHYAVVQNVLFHGLQTAIFALAFSDDDEDRELLKTKTGRFYNGMVDTILRGTGIAGGVVSVLKNTAIAWVDEQEKPSWKRDKFITFKELLKISPPLSIKERKISQADNTRAWNEKVIKEMPLTDIDNPVWPMIFKYIEGITNLPIDNAYQNYQNLKAASDSEITWWKRLALVAGWSRWDVGVENKEVEAVKKEIKQRNKRGKKNTGFGSKKNLPSL